MSLTTMVPAGAIRRLTEHYGPDVARWLRRSEHLVVRAADRWQVRLDGFHDAGWTSVVGMGRDGLGRTVVLKALPETDRYCRERTALAHWSGQGVCQLLAADDDDQVLLLEAIGGVPGGGRRPTDHMDRVAEAISVLHRQSASDTQVPSLISYYQGTVMPRLERRGVLFAGKVGRHRIDRVLMICDELCVEPEYDAMLHSDLYAENVLFDHSGNPVFIDPHAKTGSAAFDWAFWCVYYQPDVGFSDRVALCRMHVPALFDEVLLWVATLAMDGALYYLDTSDDTADAMLRVLDSSALAGVVTSGATR